MTTPSTPADDRIAALVHALVDEVRTWVDAPVEGPAQAAARMTAVAELDAAVDALRVATVQRASEHRAHELDGAPDTRTWLRTEHGASGHRAKRDCEVARALEVLPDTADALRDGRVSIETAAVLANVLRRGRLGDGAEVEAQLLDAAQTMSADQFARHARRAELHAAPEHEPRDAARQHAMRDLTMFDRPDGLWELHVVGDQAGIEIIGTAISAFMTQDPPDTPDELKRSYNTRRYDALVDACKAALDAGAAPSAGGVKPHVSVIVPVETLSDPTSVATGDYGVTGPASPESVRRAVCDSAVHRVVMGPRSEVLDVGRATRTWSAAQRRALVARDGRCRGPSCDRPSAWCDAHHIRWWERDDGPTDPDNGILLCHHCHVLVHEGGWRLEFEPDGAIATWTSPRGTEVRNGPAQRSLQTSAA